MKWKRWVGMVVVAAAVGLGLFFGFRRQPPMAEVGEVRRGPLRVTVEEEGKTRVRDRYAVSAPVAGFARRLRWRVGDAVKSGDVVAVLEPLRAEVLDSRSREQSVARVKAADASWRAAEQRLRSAEEQARVSQAEAAHAKLELERAERLHKSGDVSLDRRERASTDARRTEAALKAAEHAAGTARAQVETARAELEAARAALLDSAASDGVQAAELVTVRSPVSGRVLRLLHESEGVVRAGEPFLEIGNARALEVEVEVLSADAVKMGPATRVLFTRWGGERELEGRVRLVEPTGFTKISALGVEEQRVRVITDLTSPEEQWRRLGDGYRVEASFIVWEGDQVLQVPASALFRFGDNWAVFVVEGESARRRTVQVGHRTGLAAEVLSGAQQGERVIVHPDDTIQEGRPVAVKR